MPNLILIRHSISIAQPDIDASTWQLSAEGRARCVALAADIAQYVPLRLISSTEAKAQQTAQEVAERLDIDWYTAPDLHETERSVTDFFADRAAFVAQVQAAMAQPDQIVFGSESFNTARLRFTTQVERLLIQYPDESLALVTHGRVMAMVLGHWTKRNPFDIWQQLTMPAYAVLRLPDKTLIEQINSLEDA